MRNLLLLLVFTAIFQSCNSPQTETKQPETVVEEPKAPETTPGFIYPEEKNFKSMTQLTHGGDNAEAYFSRDDKNLVVQITNESWGLECDQIFTMPLTGYPKGGRPKMVSTGKGRTTCSFYMPGDSTIIYASTHKGGGDGCMEAVRSLDGKYVWPVFDSYDIFEADLEGNVIRQLTDSPGYDAEPTVSPNGKKIVFTSDRTGDMELYTMNIDGSELKQVTSGLGYDGGAFFSPNSKQLIFRASRPKAEAAILDYKALLKRGYVQPTNMELFICDIDGKNLRQITDLGGANWAPYMHPSGKSVVFSSNHHTESRRQFNLFSINIDGTGLKQITFDTVFDSFPMFSYDGKYLVFASNRNNGGTRDTNVFLAEWVD